LKRAGAFDYEKILSQLSPGEVPLHVLALGAYEIYGPNRNGDAFRKEACKKYHKTFVKLGHWFHNHKHNDPRKSYGIVKASIYNEPLGRIELIVFLNGTKQAAKKNKGLVASRELELLESGKELPVSMACKVDYDECSGCGNRAKTRDEYCTEDRCKYGGLSKNLGKVFDDGHKLCAFNPEPYFFDISLVPTPADRIAYTFGRIDNIKTSALQWLNGDTPNEAVVDQLEILADLAATAYDMQFNPPTWQYKYATNLKEATELTRYYNPTEIAEYFAAKGRMLSPEEFLACFAEVSGPKVMQKAAIIRQELPNAYGELIRDKNIVSILRTNQFIYDNIFPTKKDYKRLTKVAEQLPKPIKRVMSTEVASNADKELAQVYALYQIATIAKTDMEKRGYLKNLCFFV